MWTRLATSLTGSTLGLVGLGRLGAAVARVEHLALCINVVCWSENLTQETADQMAVQVGLSPDESPGGTKTFRVLGKSELFSNAVIVNLHHVLSEGFCGIVRALDLGSMKPSSLLINNLRGPLVDKSALISAFEKDKIHGCAMDVINLEPHPMDSIWRRADYWAQNGRYKGLTTPHTGYVDTTLMNAWYAETAENAERWLDGKELLHRLAKGHCFLLCVYVAVSPPRQSA